MKRLGKRENKNYRSVPFLICNRKFQNKIAKKLKKNTITASFQAKIGWKRLRKRENKNYCSILFRSYPMRNRKFHKNSKKFKKKKYDYGSFQAKIGRKWMRNM